MKCLVSNVLHRIYGDKSLALSRIRAYMRTRNVLIHSVFLTKALNILFSSVFFGVNEACMPLELKCSHVYQLLWMLTSLILQVGLKCYKDVLSGYLYSRKMLSACLDNFTKHSLLRLPS